MRRTRDPALEVALADDSILVTAYRDLVRDLLLALAEQMPRGRLVPGLFEALAAVPLPDPMPCGGPAQEYAMLDFARGTDRAARLMRLLNAECDRRLEPGASGRDAP